MNDTQAYQQIHEYYVPQWCYPKSTDLLEANNSNTIMQPENYVNYMNYDMQQAVGIPIIDFNYNESDLHKSYVMTLISFGIFIGAIVSTFFTSCSLIYLVIENISIGDNIKLLLVILLSISLFLIFFFLILFLIFHKRFIKINEMLFNRKIFL